MPKGRHTHYLRTSGRMLLSGMRSHEHNYDANVATKIYIAINHLSFYTCLITHNKGAYPFRAFLCYKTYRKNFPISKIMLSFVARVTYILILGQNSNQILYKILGKPVKVVIGEIHNDFMPACK